MAAAAVKDADGGGDESKKREDFSVTIETTRAEADAMAKGGDLEGALTKMLALEKRTRLAVDGAATAKVCSGIIELCWEAGDVASLQAHVQILSKRRAQLTAAVTATVQSAMKHLDDIKDEEVQESLIEILRTVSAGKIYVEVERARLTKRLSNKREAEGKIKEASETLQEVQVETFGSMDKREKVDFILEQMRLTIAQRDFIRTQIISQKVSKKIINGEGMEDLKVRYYRLLIELHQHQEEPMKLAKDFEAIYETKTILEVEAEWQDALKNVALFVALSPFDNEQNDFMLKLLKDRKMESLPAHSALLRHLTTDLVIPPLVASERETINSHLDEVGGKWAEQLGKRVLQHNIRVLSSAYTRLTTKRMCELLELDAVACETALSEMVSKKLLHARIDRPSGIVSFEKPKEPSEILGEWSGDVEACLSLLEKTTHLINREFMVHGIEPRS